MNADNVRYGAPAPETTAVGFLPPSYVPPPDIALGDALSLLLTIDVAVHDVYRGYLGPMSAVDKMRDNLPAIQRLVRQALSEITAGESG